MKPYDEEWRLTQARTIGGSSAAAVLGRARFKTPHDLWQRMRAALVDSRAPDPIDDNDDMRRGRLQEPVALGLVAEALDTRVEPHDQCEFLRGEAYPWAHALPDGWTGHGELIEVKVPRPGTIARCKLNGLFAEYRLQAMHNLAVANAAGWNARRCFVGLMDPMTCRVEMYTIEYDDVFSAEIMRAEQAFYESVIANVEPPAEAAEAVEQPATDESHIVLANHEALDLMRALLRLRAIKSDVGDALEAVETRIKEMLGDKHSADFAGLARVYFKPEKGRRSLNKKAVLKTFPSIEKNEAFWNTSKAPRPFKVYPTQKLLDG